ncbi:uncharacterized protein Bfra_001636, partial [Botrytis fragariae]
HFDRSNSSGAFLDFSVRVEVWIWIPHNLAVTLKSHYQLNEIHNPINSREVIHMESLYG